MAGKMTIERMLNPFGESHKIWKKIRNIALIVLTSFVCAIFLDRVVLVWLQNTLSQICEGVAEYDKENGTLYHISTFFRYLSNVSVFSLPRIYFFTVWIAFIWSIKYFGMDAAVKYRYVFAAVLLVLLVAGKFTGSSLGFYDGMLYDNTADYQCSTLLGINQGLRGDEWATEKPYYFAQAARGFPYYNDNMMFGGCDMVISAFAPVKDILILARPDLIGFLLLPRDYAFSFYWNFRIILLFMASFELVYMLTKKEKYGIFFALAVSFAAPIQWWLSQVLMIIVWSGEYFIVLLNKILEEKERKKKLGYSLLASWFAVIYVLTMYPATQVPMGYVFAALLLYLFIEKKSEKPFGKENVKCYMCILGVLFLFLAYYYYRSGNAMGTLLNTIYPGQDREWETAAWDYELLKLVHPIMWFQYLNAINNCEASQFYSFMPFVMAALFIRMLTKQNKSHKTACYCLFWASIAMWFMAYLPHNPLINKLTLMSFSYPVRMLYAVGFSFMLIMTLLLSNNEDNPGTKEVRIGGILVSVFAFLLIFLLADNSNLLNGYFQEKSRGTVYLLVILAGYSLMGYWLISGGKKNTAGFMAFYIVVSMFTTMFVNPITFGTDSMFEKSIMKQIREIDHEDPGRWMVSGHSTISNLVTAQGVARVSGTYYYPDFEMMEVLDPEHEEIDMWNQFAHIDMRLRDSEDWEITSFDYEQGYQLGSTDRLIYLNIDLARELGVKYVLSKYEVPQSYIDTGELKELYRSELDGWAIYKVV